jgi:hypothetical protein
MQDLIETARRFAEVLELSPQQRESFLRKVDDPETRELVRSLIDADRGAVLSGFMDLMDQK